MTNDNYTLKEDVMKLYELAAVTSIIASIAGVVLAALVAIGFYVLLPILRYAFQYITG